MSDIETLDVVVKRHLQTSARCKVLETGEDVNYKASLPFDLVQGEILTIEVNKRWSHRKFDYLSGEITSRKIDINALGLEPLECIPVGEWDPKEHYWGDENEHLEPWAKPIYDFGKRQQYEIAEIIPGFDPKNWQDNPMLEATYLLQEGTLGKAREKFEDMLEKDFRCIQAYSHLAGMEFEINPFWASRFYQMGMGIGMMSLGEDFNGVLPWGILENRPFLRCIHGYGLCAWRQGDFWTAKKMFEKLLWMNPTDNSGVRFLLEDIAEGKKWEDCDC